MKGQLELSFGVIFSIIIIIATIGTATYFIMHFMNTGKCTTLQLAYADLQEGIDNAWGSAVADTSVTLHIPGGVTSLCFGDITGGQNATLREQLDAYVVEGQAVYALPPTKACDGSLAGKQLSHVTVSPFFCKPVVNGKLSVRLTKATVGERMVTLHA